MKRQTIADISSLLLMVFFVHTLVTSYINRISLRSMLSFYTPHAASMTQIILIAELLTAALLFIAPARKTGFLFTIVFGLTAITAIVCTPRYPHDFGGISNVLSHQQRLFLYIAIVLLAIAGLLLSTGKRTVKTTQPIYT